MAKKSVSKKTAKGTPVKKPVGVEKPVVAARPAPLGGRGTMHVPAPVVADDAVKTIKGLVAEAQVMVATNAKSQEPAFVFVVNSESLINVVNAACAECEFQYTVRVNEQLELPARLKTRKGY
jgi:hypothetical protein